MPSASHPPTPPADDTRGPVKGHRIALCPNDWQASLMAEYTGWAWVASNWVIDRFAEVWFTGKGEENEWFSDLALHRQFNAVKWDLFPRSKPLSQNVAKNAACNLQVFDPAAGSAVADAETRKSSRLHGLQGRRSVNRTGSPLPLDAGS